MRPDYSWASAARPHARPASRASNRSIAMTTSGVLPSDLPEVSSLIASSIRHSVTQSEDEAQFLIDYIAKRLDAWANDPGQSMHLKYTLDHTIAGIILVKQYWNLQLL